MTLNKDLCICSFLETYNNLLLAPFKGQTNL
jgi:hypothetical protein